MTMIEGSVTCEISPIGNHRRWFGNGRNLVWRDSHKVVAFDSQTLRMRWEARIPESLDLSPAHGRRFTFINDESDLWWSSSAGVIVVLQRRDPHFALIALDLKTGRVVWEKTRRASSKRINIARFGKEYADKAWLLQDGPTVVLRFTSDWTAEGTGQECESWTEGINARTGRSLWKLRDKGFGFWLMRDTDRAIVLDGAIWLQDWETGKRVKVFEQSMPLDDGMLWGTRILAMSILDRQRLMLSAYSARSRRLLFSTEIQHAKSDMFPFLLPAGRDHCAVVVRDSEAHVMDAKGKHAATMRLHPYLTDIVDLGEHRAIALGTGSRLYDLRHGTARAVQRAPRGGIGGTSRVSYISNLSDDNRHLLQWGESLAVLDARSGKVSVVDKTRGWRCITSGKDWFIAHDGGGKAGRYVSPNNYVVRIKRCSV